MPNHKFFSAKFACPECGYSLTELEPRLFSFNNPAGACPSCDGLGRQEFFNPEQVIQDDSLSLAGGAIRGWDRRNLYYFQMLNCLAQHYDFDIDKPFAELAKNVQALILYGSGKEKIHFKFVTDRGSKFNKKKAFEGVIPSMERRYRETESIAIREDLARYISDRPCVACAGSRLREEARHVLVNKRNIAQITSLAIEDAKIFFDKLKFKGARAKIADKIQKEIFNRLTFLVNVGLDYLSLDRSSGTLSGGEAQRIRLASQIGSGLVGVMYILDEPSIGLHQRDNQRLLKTLNHLRDIGNTVIVVEHDEEAILAADHVIDIGPGAGVHGGEILVEGTPKKVMACKDSITGQFLSGRRKIEVPKQRLSASSRSHLIVKGATGNNLKHVKIKIPLGLLTCVTGVSGSGKSTLINDTLYPIIARALNGSKHLQPKPYESVEGLEHLDKVVDIDQSPIGRTPRSNPATYAGMFTAIRELYAGTQEARARGYKVGRFSFNVKGGRCEACQGGGMTKVEMHFLADVYVTCDVCKGKRYNRETLEILYKGKNIYEVLKMTVEQAHQFF